MQLLLTLFLSSWISVIHAGSVHHDQPCNIKLNRLLAGSLQFTSECDSQTFCNTFGTCQRRGCRRDDFPFGYSQGDKGIPNKCPKGQFCPDEEDQCQPLLPVGSPCQLNRDDQCEGPPNFNDLADKTGRGYNFNGSVCLNNVCTWANKTAGEPCIVENTAYIGYGADGQTAEFINIVSRGNCQTGNYCDAPTKTCIKNKPLKASCSADKECDSFNCLSSGVCGHPADVPNQFPAWVYVLVAFGIIGAMVGTLYGMYTLHYHQREREREKRLQYWHEQNAFHQGIMQMRETASQVLNQSSSRRSSMDYSRENFSTDSHVNILAHAATTAAGRRHHLSDDASDWDHHMLLTAEPMSIERRVDGRF